jgi:hypothetical protein
MMINTTNISVTIHQSVQSSIRRWLLMGLGAYGFGVLTGIGYFTIGGIFALLSDAASIAMAVTMIPVVLGLAKIFERHNKEFSKIARLVGLTGFTLLGTGGAILVLFYFLRTLPGGLGLGMQFAGIFLQGIWLMLVGILSQKTGTFSQKVSIAAIVGGVGYFVVGAGSAFGFSPILYLASAVSVGAYVLWALWTRAELSSDEKRN